MLLHWLVGCLEDTGWFVCILSGFSSKLETLLDFSSLKPSWSTEIELLCAGSDGPKAPQQLTQMKRPCKVCEMLLLLLFQLHESGCLWRGRSHFALILLIENLHCYHSNRKHSALAAYSWWNLLVSAQPQLIFFFRLSVQKCGCICLQIQEWGHQRSEGQEGREWDRKALWASLVRTWQWIRLTNAAVCVSGNLCSRLRGRTLLCLLFALTEYSIEMSEENRNQVERVGERRLCCCPSRLSSRDCWGWPQHRVDSGFSASAASQLDSQRNLQQRWGPLSESGFSKPAH